MAAGGERWEGREGECGVNFNMPKRNNNDKRNISWMEEIKGEGT